MAPPERDSFLESLMDTNLYSMGAYFSDQHPELVDEVIEQSTAIEEQGIRALLRAERADAPGVLRDAHDRARGPLLQGRRVLAAQTRPRGLCDNCRFVGAWRSLVARTVRVGEVPGSNPGAPMYSPHRPSLGVSPPAPVRSPVRIRAPRCTPHRPSLGEDATATSPAKLALPGFGEGMLPAQFRPRVRPQAPLVVVRRNGGAGKESHVKSSLAAGRRGCLAARVALLAGTAVAASKKAPNKATITIKSPVKYKKNKFIQDGSRYIPGNVAIKSGGKLTLKNRSDQPHTFSIVQKKDQPKNLRQVLSVDPPARSATRSSPAHVPDPDGNPTKPVVDVGPPGSTRSGTRWS